MSIPRVILYFILGWVSVVPVGVDVHARQIPRDSAAYARCLQSPRGVGVAETLTGSGDDEAHARYVAIIKAAYEDARKCLERLQERDGYRGTTIFDAVRFVAEQDLDLPHLFPGLRVGLRELAGHYGYIAARKAA